MSSRNNNEPRYKDQVGEFRVERLEEEEAQEHQPPAPSRENPPNESPPQSHTDPPSDPPGSYDSSRTDSGSFLRIAPQREVRYKDQVTSHTEGQTDVPTPPVVQEVVREESTEVGREEVTEVVMEEATERKHSVPEIPQPMDGNLIVVNAVQVNVDDVTVSIPNSSQPEKPEEETKNSSLWAEEKSFLVKMMMIALFLNTLLAVGVVVGGFCLSGACGSKDETTSALTPSPPNTIGAPAVAPVFPALTAVPVVAPTPVPTMVPTAGTTTMAPTQTSGSFLPPFFFGGVPTILQPIPFIPTLTQPTGTQALPVPPPSEIGALPAPPPPIALPFPPPPPTISTPLPGPLPPIAAPVPQPIVAMGAFPISAPAPAEESSSNNRALTISILVPVVLVFEMILIGSLCTVYRRWRSKRLEASAAKVSKTETDPNMTV